MVFVAAARPRMNCIALGLDSCQSQYRYRGGYTFTRYCSRVCSYHIKSKTWLSESYSVSSGQYGGLGGLMSIYAFGKKGRHLTLVLELPRARNRIQYHAS